MNFYTYDDVSSTSSCSFYTAYGSQYKYGVFLPYVEECKSFAAEVFYTLRDTHKVHEKIICIDFKDYIGGKTIEDNYLDCLRDSYLTVLPLCKAFLRRFGPTTISGENRFLCVKLEECVVPEKFTNAWTIVDYNDPEHKKHLIPKILNAINHAVQIPEPVHIRSNSTNLPSPVGDKDDTFASVDVVAKAGAINTHDPNGPHVWSELLTSTNVHDGSQDVDPKQWSLTKFYQNTTRYLDDFAKTEGKAREKVERLLIRDVLPRIIRDKAPEALLKLACSCSDRVQLLALDALLDWIRGPDSVNITGTECHVAEKVLRQELAKQLEKYEWKLAVRRLELYAHILVRVFVVAVQGDVACVMSQEQVKAIEKSLGEHTKHLDEIKQRLTQLSHYKTTNGEKLSTRYIRQLINSSIDYLWTVLPMLKQRKQTLSHKVILNSRKVENARDFEELLNEADWMELPVLLHFFHNETLRSLEMVRALQAAMFKRLRRLGKDSEKIKYALNVLRIFMDIITYTENAEISRQILRGSRTEGRNEIGLLNFLPGNDNTEFERKFKVLDQIYDTVTELLKPLLYHKDECVRETVAKRVLKFSPEGNGVVREQEDQIREIMLSTIADRYKFFSFRVTLNRTTFLGENVDRGTEVLRGELLGQGVALKHQKFMSLAELKNPRELRTRAEEFHNDLKFLKKLKDGRRVVRLFGYQLQPLPMFYITELMELGNLSQFLRNRKERDELICLAELCEIILDMISALKYCHENKIVHRDVTAQSFLGTTSEDRRYGFKLSNFGLARNLDEPDDDVFYETLDAVNGVQLLQYSGSEDDNIPTLWSAPESLLNCEYSVASDVWMLGHTMHEVLTHGCYPYHKLQKRYSATEQILYLIRQGYILPQPSCIPDELYWIMRGCFVLEPHDRHSLDHIEKEILAYKRNCRFPDIDDQLILHAPPDHQGQPQKPNRGIPRGLYTNVESDHHQFDVVDGIRRMVSQGCFPCDYLETIPEDIEEPSKSVGRHSGDRSVEIYEELLKRERDKKEAQALMELRHGGIVTVTMHTNLQLSEHFAACEKMGTLLEVASQTEKTTPALLHHYLTQVVDAMEYMHSKGIIHTDLRARYIQVSVNNQVKICRLGRACRLVMGIYDQDLWSVKVRKPMPPDSTRWAAPEVIESDVYSQASDVFSFGVVSFEVFNVYNLGANFNRVAALPYSHLKSDQILDFLRHRETLFQPKFCPDWCFLVMKKCWHLESIRRPTFAEIVEVFRSLDGTQWNCPLLSRFKKNELHIENMYQYIPERPLPPIPPGPSRVAHVLEKGDEKFYNKGSIKQQSSRCSDPGNPYASLPTRLKLSTSSRHSQENTDGNSLNSASSHLMASSDTGFKSNPLYENSEGIVANEFSKRQNYLTNLALQRQQDRRSQKPEELSYANQYSPSLRERRYRVNSSPELPDDRRFWQNSSRFDDVCYLSNTVQTQPTVMPPLHTSALDDTGRPELPPRPQPKVSDGSESRGWRKKLTWFKMIRGKRNRGGDYSAKRCQSMLELSQIDHGANDNASSCDTVSTAVADDFMY
ncbi:uncharacterized protein [Ptychodera flava]|uniref:uncharacterized protein n=1 Tax=Ptychodera flava TaxID=63121 RepID=UPI00396A0952